MTGPIAIVALTADGEALARRLAGALPAAEVHGLATRTAAPDVPFTDTLAHVGRLFGEERAIVGICAAGILIRALAPHLNDKRSEPPVIAVAADGSHAVPLLGGHAGGNKLATEIATALCGSAAVTTAGDTGLGIALDDPPPGWSVANSAAAKAVAAAHLSGTPATVWREADLPLPPGLLAEEVDTPQEANIHVRLSPPIDGVLTLHPQMLTLGVGCERDTDPAELETLVRGTMDEAGLALDAIACVTSLDLKADENAVLDLAATLDRPARFFDAATLEAETPRLANPSDVVFAEVGCHGVAEGSALAAAGPDADLIIPKNKSKRATCAVAQASDIVDPASVGRARGRLSIVGIGPGQAAWRTPEVTAWLSTVTDVVGYGLYLDLLGDLIDGKKRHMSDLSEEEKRVRRSLELAAEGRDVALVSSGDAGIYAMAALAFEVLDRDDAPAFNRIEIRCSPGISAVQAAAARIGAPLGHDFALISLSDLLTPWEVIEKRLHAAAEGDFVVAFYNPVSKRRRTQLAAAREILLGHRPPETPVVLGRNLGRADETVEVVTLHDLTVDMVDMLTLVLVGSANTRHVRRGGKNWVYTPRGYLPICASE